MGGKRDGWLICDGPMGGYSFSKLCLYSEDGARKLDRCIRHGAILTWLGWGAGMSRRQVRAKMREADERAAFNDDRRFVATERGQGEEK